MWIDKWLMANNMTLTDFANTLRYNRSHIKCIVKKRRRASEKMSKEIVTLTNGDVTYDELRCVSIVPFPSETR